MKKYILIFLLMPVFAFAQKSGGTIGSGNVGTVTSVGLTVPTGLSVSGSPVTGSGVLGITNNMAAGFVKSAGVGLSFTSATIQSSDISSLAVLLGGNTGPITAGTNNATPFHLETNNTRRLSIPSSGIANTPASTKALVLSSTDSLGYTTLQSSSWDNTVTQSGSDTLLNSASGYGHFTRVGNVVTFTVRIEIALTNTGNANTVYISPPIASAFSTAQSDVIGTATLDSQGLSSANTARQRALLFADTVDDKIGISFDPVASLTYPENRMYISASGSYLIQ